MSRNLMSQIAFTAPHHAAAKSGMDVLREGGSAIDAMIAAAATIAVVYPHMNSWGGDGFWLIQRAGEKPVAIDACGYSAQGASKHFYTGRGLQAIPERGGAAALAMAGTLQGWQQARNLLAEWGLPQLPLGRLFTDACHYATEGVEVTQSLQAASEKTFAALKTNAAFAEIFLPQGKPLQAGERLINANLAVLLNQLAEQGLDSFYRGDIAATIAAQLQAQDSPLALADFQDYYATQVEPLTTAISVGALYNLPPPTQGLASLIILALYDRVYQAGWTEQEKIHHLVECIKQAFLVRNAQITDPSRMAVTGQSLLDDAALDMLARNIRSDVALPWPHVAKPGDTVWMGALDKDGTLVSFIQSVYWEFGSGVVIPEYGLVWNNRGTSFSLDEQSLQFLQPRTKPFHTLNPALAELGDGRRISYGTMGGEGQPQTQAAVFSRFVYEQMTMADAIAAERWLLGRTWGDVSHNLKLEQGLADRVGSYLASLGHDLQVVPDRSEMMGHAGGICLAPDGAVDVATDPRSDGAALLETYCSP